MADSAAFTTSCSRGSADDSLRRSAPRVTPAIVYLHGFNSAPQSLKGQLIARAAERLPQPPLFHMPRLPHRPAQAMRDVRAWIDANVTPGRELALIGSSLGGYYATWLAEKYGVRAVVVNPAIRPYIGLRAYLGPQQNLYTGAKYTLTERHLHELEALRIAAPTRLERYYLMVTTGDEVLDYREAVRWYTGGKQLVIEGSDHGFADFGDHVDSVLSFAGIAA
jgi:uncharacterized protein